MDFLDKITAIAKDAGMAIMEVYNSGDFGETTKDDNSPLTRADLAANDIITAGLATLTPDVPILSEESRKVPYEERRGWEKFWLVDPLDGTKEFLKRNDEFTVNIALIENGTPTLGVVYAPAIDVLYYANKDNALKAIGEAAPVKIKVADGEANKARPRIAASRSHRTEELSRFLDAIGEFDEVVMGSSLKLCLVAEGAADLYPRIGPTMEWDTGAAHAIVKSCGGEVTDISGTPLRYNKPDLLNPYFFVFGDPPFPWQGLIKVL